jgi:ribosomal protein L11 methyltransferase
MDLNYAELICRITNRDSAEWLMALLSEAGFESFAEGEEGFSAYIPTVYYADKEDYIRSVLENHPDLIGWEWQSIEAQNWNERWEKEYPPVWIENRLLVKASFHDPLPAASQAMSILIDPKMSFGTGHHSTTTLVCRRMLDMSFEGKDVLDMGCGTGILAILASKLGARRIVAVDNHPWASINTTENCDRNKVSNVLAVEGDASSLGSEQFDVVLANINRNILLEDMSAYRLVMRPGAELVLSGFFEEDLPSIKSEAERNGLSYAAFARDGKWVAAWFTL